MPNCPTCAEPADDGQKFCFECGAPLASACPGCGTPFPAGAKFCGECGHRLAEATEATAAAPAPERRLVSVLFADLVGYSTMSEHRDPEDVRAFLSAYFTVARDVVERYGGTVEKFIGDAVMGTWGSPVAREDDAERAVRAALDLTTEIEHLGARSETDVAVRVGVATGEVAVLLHAPASEGMAGDLVNSAARLEGLAEPGTVLVNVGTHRAAGRAIAFQDMGEVTVKGKSDTIHAFRPLRVAAKVGAAAPSTLTEPAFVGRREELQLLRESARRSADERRAHLVSVIGVAGIGKSRLIDELEKHLDGLTATTYWHRGRSPAYGDGVTFWALSEMVKNRAGIVDADDEETQRARLVEVVDRFVEDEDRAWVTTGLGVLLGLQAPGAMEAGEAEAAWRRFFEAIAAEAPVVMVFEDLHWADHGLIDFIEAMLGWSRRHPVTIVTLARPELLERRPTWGAGLPGFTSIHLDRLDDEEVDRMLESMAPGLPAEVKAQVAERAEGVPLYIVETVRILADAGTIRVTESGTEVTGPVEFSVPESLHALIAARLDALGTDDRRLVQHAAVLGQTFEQKALAEVTGIPAGDLGPRLERLVVRQILRVDDDPRSNERGFHQFVQSVIREVALGTISRAERRDLHLRIAAHMEGLDDTEMLPVIVHHLSEAMALGPPTEAAELRARALGLLSRAAERASTLGSHEQEISFLEQALTLTEDPADTAALIRRLAHATEISGHAARSTELWRDAHSRMAELGDAEQGAAVAARLANSLMMASKLMEATEILDAALDRAEAEGVSSSALGWLFAERARTAAFVGDGATAIALADRAGSLGDPAGDLDLVVEAMVTRAWGMYLCDRQIEGVATNRAALQLAEEHDSRGAFRARNNIASFLFWSDPAESRELCLAGIDIALRNGDIENYASMAAKASWTSMEVGRWDDTRAMLDAIPALPFTDFARGQLEAIALVFHSMRGDLDRAAEPRARTQARIDSESEQDREVAHTYTAIADAALGRFDEALAGITAAEDGFNGGNHGRVALVAVQARDRTVMDRIMGKMRSNLRLDDRSAGWLAAMEAITRILDGDPDAGQKLVDRAHWFRERGLAVDAGHLFGEAALLLPDGEDRDEAEESAREIWRSIEAASLLDLLDRRLATERA